VSARLDLVEHYAMTWPDEVARHVERLDPDHAVIVFSALPHPTAASLLPHLAAGHAARIVADLPAEAAAAVTGLMRADGAASLLRRMNPAVVSRILGELPADQARGVSALLAHGPATAGGVMDPDVLTVPVAATVADARILLETAPEHLYYYVYVIDVEHRLAGVFDLAELMQADPGEPVRAIIKPSVTWLSADAPLDSVFAHPGWRTFDAMPVVDSDRRFLGVLRHRRMRQLQEQESTANNDDGAVRIVMALGELYWLGLGGLLQGLASTATTSAASGEPS
jgi:magnesium transporter